MKDRIRQIRKELRMSQTDFGEATGKSRDTIANYEQGRVIPDDTWIMFLSQKFGYSGNWIRTGDGEPKRPENMAFNLGVMYAEAANLDPDAIRARLIEIVRDMPPERIVAMWQLWKSSRFRRQDPDE